MFLVIFLKVLVIHQDSLGNYKDGTSKDDKEWQVSLEAHDPIIIMYLFKRVLIVQQVSSIIDHEAKRPNCFQRIRSH
jgi:hypothetical protein